MKRPAEICSVISLHTSPLIRNSYEVTFIHFNNNNPVFSIPDISAQGRQAEIDSLIVLFKDAGREWNEYARQFIQIGEPAVPALIALLEDKSMEQWTRRISAMTLNDIHSPLYIKTALKILTDRDEDPGVRNQVTNGLKGHDLSGSSEKLWEVFNEEPDQFFRLNVAGILRTSDTALAYLAYREIYPAAVEGYVKQQALLNIVRLRPGGLTCINSRKHRKKFVGA